MGDIQPIIDELTELTKTEADKMGDAIIDALQTKYEKQKELDKQAIKDNAALSEEEKELRLQAIEEKYDAIMDAEALENEALAMATADSQDELLKLLADYNPKWQDAGQSFGDKLINGLNSTQEPMNNAVARILDQVDLVQTAMEDLEAQQDKIVAAQVDVYQKQQAAAEAAAAQQTTQQIVGYGSGGQPIYAGVPTKSNDTSSDLSQKIININVSTPKQLSEVELMRLAKENATVLALAGS